ncbi:MAG: DUF2744 domain-containing protein [Porticoccaceae bacterium]|nr:DUF2744 domain-containing protein [Porticoccaceae bacterium]
MDFPTRDNCDPTNPEEAFLWMLVALPGMKGGQLLMPVEYLRQVSKRLWECGARPVEEPEIEYQKPSGNEPHWLTSPGKWRPAGTVAPASEVDQVDAALSQMGFQQRGELYTALCAWERGADLPETEAGKVVSTLTDHQRGVILARLRKDDA